jgi:16S rRNA (uracil1498-N3)-methyltransferase
MPLMHTFLFAPEDRSESQITIAGEEARHLFDVLRLHKGDMVRLVDGGGEAHICEIIESTKKNCVCSIIKSIRNGGEPRIRLTLAVGLSSASKFETVLEKGTEIGVSRFVPLYTQKGKVRQFDKATLTRKLKRWQRVCAAALKQAGRSRLPAVEMPIGFEEFISSCPAADTALFHPEGRNAFQHAQKLFRADTATLLVGPESGFSDEEIRLAREKDIPVISIGDRTLRTETAGIVIPALFIFLSDSVNEQAV